MQLEGTRSNRAGLGATVIVTAGGRTQARAVLSQASYYSHDDLRLHFGLGGASRADRVEVRWPSGAVDVLKDVEGRRVVTVREGSAASGRPEDRPTDYALCEEAPWSLFFSAQTFGPAFSSAQPRFVDAHFPDRSWAAYSASHAIRAPTGPRAATRDRSTLLAPARPSRCLEKSP